MNTDLIPFTSQDTMESFQGTFMVPADWESCGVAIHVSGGSQIGGNQPIALAITNSFLSLCSYDGPKLSIPLLSIEAVKVVDLTGISFSINTPSGITEMVPPRAKGVSITYTFNPLGTQVELTLYTLTPKSAYQWVNEIMEAIQRKSSELGNSGSIQRR